MKKPLKQKITDYINSLSEELRSSLEYKKKKPKTPKLRKVASLLLVFSLVIYLLIGCFGSIKSSAEESYQLSGSWIFLDTLDVSTDFSYCDLAFYRGVVRPANPRQMFTCFRSYVSEANSQRYFDIRNNYTSISLYNVTTSSWVVASSDLPYIITFDGVNTVSQEFYEWFTSNAYSSDSSTLVSPGLYFLRYPLSTLRGTISFSTPFVSHSNFYTSIEFVGIESNEQLSINYVDSEDNITNVYYGDTGWRDDEYSVILVQQPVVLAMSDYDLFNGAFVSLAENDTLNTLYNAGLENGQAFGYSQGYDSGYDLGYTDGFTTGVADGMADGFMGSFFGGIVEALDSLKLFGEFSVLNIIEGVLGLMLVLWILKLIAGG